MKEELIQLFKKFCQAEENTEYRRSCTETQYRRDAWVIDIQDGKIRIERGQPSLIIAWFKYEYYKRTGCPDRCEFPLTQGEYGELERLFMGNFRNKYDNKPTSRKNIPQPKPSNDAPMLDF